MLRLRTVCLVAVALAAGGFFVGRMLVAQDKTEKGNRADRRGGGGYGLGKLTLLKNADVQKDLNITDEQKTTLSKFTEEMQSEVRKQLEGLKDLSQEDRRAKLSEMRSKLGDREKDVQKKLEDVLNTSQRDRLAQIELQAELASRRIDVFTKKEVAEGLAITDEQKQKLTELRESISKEMREARGPGAQVGPPTDDARAKMKKLGEESMDKAKEILTSEQREKLEKMAGKKVDFDLSTLGGFGGRNGFGGRRGRGGAGTDKAPEKSADKPAEKTTDKPAGTTEKTDAAPTSK